MWLELLWGSLVFAAALLFVALSVFILKTFVTSLSGRSRFSESSTWLRKLLFVAYLALLLGLSIFASFPAYLKKYDTITPLLESDSPFSLTLHDDYPDFTIVTFSSDGYTDPLENMIGSLNVWAKGVPVVVYDLGLSAQNRARIAALENVRVVLFNFSAYPTHVQFMNNYAFKPLLIYDAVKRFGTVLSLDAGIEVRSSLRRVFESIKTVGYFFVEASDVDPLTRVHPTTVKVLNMTPPSSKEVQCYAGMHGYRAHSFAVREVLAPTVRCALNPNCIDPKGSGHNNHRYEQVVFSLYIRRHHLHCTTGRMYNEHLPTTLDPNPLTPNQPQVFFFRRWRYPKPYAKYAIKRTTAVSVSTVEDTNVGIRENGFTDRKNADNKLLQCLRNNEYILEKCKQEQQEWSQKVADKPLLGTPELRAREERRGAALALAARVFWYWPFSLGSACYIVLCGLVLLALDHFRLGKYVTAVIVGFLFTYLVFRHLGSPQFCKPTGKVSFSAASIESPHEDASVPRGIVECQGLTSKVSYATSPTYLHYNGAVYAFFESSALGFSLIHYATRSASQTAWMYMGVAVMQPFSLERPCVFVDRNKYFMLPINPSDRRVLLYSTHSLPTHWHVARDLVTLDEPSVPVLYEVRGVYYLAVRGLHSGAQAVFKSHSLLTEPFTLTVDAPPLAHARPVCNYTV